MIAEIIAVQITVFPISVDIILFTFNTANIYIPDIQRIRNESIGNNIVISLVLSIPDKDILLDALYQCNNKEKYPR